LNSRPPTDKPSFWSTLPGILTALGGLIVAITGLLPLILSRCSSSPKHQAPYVIIERITVTEVDGTTIDPPVQVEVSVNNKNYYYPTKTDPTRDGPRLRASQIKRAGIPLETDSEYYVAVRLLARGPFNSPDGFFFPSEHPFSQVVTAHLFRRQPNPTESPAATATVDLTIENK